MADVSRLLRTSSAERARSRRPRPARRSSFAGSRGRPPRKTGQNNHTRSDLSLTQMVAGQTSVNSKRGIKGPALGSLKDARSDPDEVNDLSQTQVMLVVVRHSTGPGHS
jgi:hypothetical protein